MPVGVSRNTVLNMLLCCVLLMQKLLREEVSHLRHKVDHHPEVTRYAMENMELKSEGEGLAGWAEVLGDIPVSRYITVS